MKKTSLLLTALTLAACESNPPKDYFYAFGDHYTSRGATEIATDDAKKFCRQWWAKPVIKNKQTAERGRLPDSAILEIEQIDYVTPWTPSKAKWETRLVYQCL